MKLGGKELMSERLHGIGYKQGYRRVELLEEVRVRGQRERMSEMFKMNRNKNVMVQF